MANWLVVGLGNPGPTYASHRHNIGYLVVEELARRAGVKFSRSLTLRAETAQTRVTAAGIGAVGAEASQVVLVKSRTFMNESGLAVAKASAYYKVKPANLLVIHDELDLDFGQLRLKFGGGDNGHNGLKSIRQSLGTGEFPRLRFGIGRPPGRQDPADFVLAPFPSVVAADLATEIVRAADAAQCLLTDGLEAAQNQFNS
ncbi:aminoacyl-tRNA hydrolase [Propionicimonas sp.]|uniref:aminoacyl-tRNA hydrolase n=1 Tax=Propionicimonas sp. TaxID=1955623 RepID=UPI00181ADBB4|nr:aminoacyl-tRNA hydrolase [Propionicimonas sp.]MBU3976475.1 aminoacyl-tRNA hydrolase [Actinomycetota bacterium]MBA3020315.1 aminoacyl-tRNA hydrolase [Propionicimonas sp.]MBU3987307.1 aminoacyl-tRNA hydrolase [Actinomycetota bacterium]MBU4007619.1 aminoacyl-tRNA hydrolase [Actinomycetota bacterium]MBU4064400.1 aminoacyl-tRNA hydrolase [Actinomycetota bacterium]